MSDFISVTEASERFNFSQRRVRQLACRLGARRGRRWLISVKAMERYVRGQRPLPPTRSELSATLIEAGQALRENDPKFPTLMAGIIAEFIGVREAADIERSADGIAA